MAQYVNTNISSLTAQKNLNASQSALQTSMARLSSGMRINTAQDDAAGFAIATRLTSQINGIGQATLNANDAISLTQTADSGMQSIANNLQKMRTLSVQASNSTYTASDRASMNDEVQQLKGEIDRVAGGTNFNGLKLLDGSFTSQSFQVGASNTTNDTIQVTSISSMTTAALGGVGTSAQTSVTGAKPTAALTAGDLTLNGIQVGNSELGAEAGQSTGSAFSIAQAINLANTGVTATANKNTLEGAAATTGNFTAIAADTFSINGINVGAVAAGGNAQGQGANLAAAINKVSTQTGVTAAADTKTGAVTLTASDGRDIAISMNGTETTEQLATDAQDLLAAQTGFTATTQIGRKADSAGASGAGASTDIATNAGAVTLASGPSAWGKIASGTFSIKNANTNGDSGTLNTALTIGEVAGGTDVESQVTNLANAINTAIKSQNTGTPDLVASVTGTGSAAKLTLTDSNGTAADVSIDMLGTASDKMTAADNKTNFTALTGFSSAQAGTQAYSHGAGTAYNHGSISLSSTSSDGIIIGGNSARSAGLSAAIGQNGPTTTSSISAVEAVDISTQSGAQNALSSIDGAISMVNKSQGLIGALQNRFQSAVSNLQATSTNLSAARSRIQDTDFASETASMTRSQVLQQAGMAILGQANQAPNQVMGLLR